MASKALFFPPLPFAPPFPPLTTLVLLVHWCLASSLPSVLEVSVGLRFPIAPVFRGCTFSFCFSTLAFCFPTARVLDATDPDGAEDDAWDAEDPAVELRVKRSFRTVVGAGCGGGGAGSSSISGEESLISSSLVALGWELGGKGLGPDAAPWTEDLSKATSLSNAFPSSLSGSGTSPPSTLASRFNRLVSCSCPTASTALDVIEGVDACAWAFCNGG
jgi:hypothetical protein